MAHEIDAWLDPSYNVNYFFKDGLAYTEDKILVYNIFVYKIPHKVKQDEALCYFSEFGKITKLQLVPDKKRAKQSAPKVGFINFEDPFSAAKVLLRSQHILGAKRIQVKACDSWRQPKTKNNEDEEPISEDASQLNDDVLNILDLNDDCLEHICKLLTLRDQVNFSRSCFRFRAVFKMCSKLQNKVFELDSLHGMTLWEMYDFFQAAGKSMEKLHGSQQFCRDPERITEFISNFCPNVKCIDFHTCHVKVGCLHKIVAKLKLLETLRLTNCRINDNAIALIRKIPKLRELSLSENFDIQGINLHLLNNVTDLNLHGCGNIQSVHIVSMFKSLTQLRSLNMQRIDQLTSTTFSQLAQHCKNLEILKMSCPSINYDCISMLPKLRHLELLAVSSHVPIRPELFVALAKHKANQLEVLKIIARNSITLDTAVQIGRLENLKLLMVCYNDFLTDEFLRKFADIESLESIDIKHCPQITNDGVMQIVRRCRKLRRINLQRCGEITNSFVFDAIKELRKRSKDIKTPIIFYVGKTKIEEQIEENEKFCETPQLVKLSFPTPISSNFVGDGYNDDNIDLFFDDDYDYGDEDDFDLSDDDLQHDIEFDFLYHDSDFENSDLDDDDYHMAYNIFAGYGPYGDDVNDFIF